MPTLHRYIEKVEILIQEISKFSDNLKTSEVTSENDIIVYASQKHPKNISKIPIQEIPARNKSKSKTKPVRTRKKKKAN